MYIYLKETRMNTSGQRTADTAGTRISFFAAVAVAGSVYAADCIQQFQRSCAALHANTGRVCRTGNHAVPCGDIVVLDSQVTFGSASR